jgi:hypothetical protein
MSRGGARESEDDLKKDRIQEKLITKLCLGQGAVR